MERSFLNYDLRCTVCGEVVTLETSRTNERGQAMHSECAVKSANEQTNLCPVT
jgi:hypothetical protein